ncbi:MAG TPA: right-handed parallel beta-helix repeat-containing protein [Candidatus Acidoferrum sp.]|jgi:hypothetical protein|nr:right-handed parallel beta-helix repeat-containing protein [Candidatus Acidoferrum sp.]
MLKTMVRWLVPFLIVSAALCCLPARAAQIRVPADQPTIQQGIGTAASGDTVLVSPGIYYEGISFSKNIVVMSESGPETTIIDGGRSNRVATITGSLGRTAGLQGFTLRNGNGGLYLSGASVRIAGNIIISNVLCAGGVGIDVEFCSPLIISNIIAGNTPKTGCSGDNGAGILVAGAASAELVHNIITNNSTTGHGGGIELFASGTPIIRENLIGWNTSSEGGGIDIVNYGDATIVNNVIVSNSAASGGGIYVLVPSGRRGPYVVNNTIVNNSATTGLGVYSDGFDKAALVANNIIVAAGSQTALYIGSFNDTNQPIIRFNDLFAPSGQAFGGLGANPVGTNGNISADPLFLNPALKDYRLRSTSPAIDAGLNSDAPTNDFDYASRPYNRGGNGTNQVDLGAFEWSPTRAKQLSLIVNGNTQPVLTWVSSGGVQYRVQYSNGDSLGGFNGVFTDIVRAPGEETDPGPSGVASVMSYTDTNSLVGATWRFYRIKTVAQP